MRVRLARGLRGGAALGAGRRARRRGCVRERQIEPGAQRLQLQRAWKEMFPSSLDRVKDMKSNEEQIAYV